MVYSFCFQVTPGARVALRNDSYTLHVLLPTKVDPLVSLMKVEKVPDSTYDMVGGLDQQIKEIKEVGAVCVCGCGCGGGGANEIKEMGGGCVHMLCAWVGVFERAAWLAVIGGFAAGWFCEA